MKLYENETGKEKLCDLAALSEMMFGKKHLILDIIDTFLKQVTVELSGINQAILMSDFQKIKNSTHSMKSSVFIMGISSLIPILSEMESLGGGGTGISDIERLNGQLSMICSEVVEELENARLNYL